MKKTVLLFALAATTLTTQAQVNLPAPPYVETFDQLTTSGLPTGWSCYAGTSTSSSGAPSSTSLGTLEPLVSNKEALPYYTSVDTTCKALVISGGFKNYPSARVINSGLNFCAATPPSFSNRALGLRQVSSTSSSFPDSGDPGGTFLLTLSNTINRFGFKATFWLQSLDTSSSRTTPWTVDYGFSTTGPFTAVTPTSGTMTTGGKTFSNNLITIDFGSAIDDKTSKVYIRIISGSSTGSGNRASTAIDSFVLNYTSHVTEVASIAAPKLAFNVIGNATSSAVNFIYNAEQDADYNFSIYDLSGRMLHSEIKNIKSGSEQFAVTGLTLAPGMYIAKMSNSNSSAVAKIIVQ